MGRELIAALAIGITACGGARPAPAHEARSERADTERADTERAGSERAERVRVRVMRVLFASRTPEQARERARMLARTARADDFSQLASEYGEGPRATELGAGGLVIDDSSREVPVAVRDAALGLALREVSSPIETDDGLWILERVD